MEVQEALEQLAQAVKESEVYREYRRQSERVDNAGDMREKIDEYRVRNLVEEFLDAELAFCRMMQEIDVKLAEAMDFE